MSSLKKIVEWNVYGICTRLGIHLGISTSRIRLWFIYLSLLTMGSPIIIYMAIAFIRNLRKYSLLSRRNPLKWL